jgi:hypothetical protein
MFLTRQEETDVKGDMLEIGCYHGQSAAVLATALREGETLICNDLFMPCEDTRRDGHVVELKPPTPTEFVDNLRKAGVDIQDKLIIAQCSSQELTTTRKFRFIHIDGNHSEEYAMQDILFAIGHLAPGGVIAVDDWRSWQWPGVGNAVTRILQMCQGLALAHYDHHKAYLKVESVGDVPIVLAKTKRGGLPTMGRKSHKGAHRSGWPHCLHALSRLEKQHPETLIFEDFVERTFYKIQHSKPWRAPWVGVFHHPPMMPPWFAGDTPQKLLTVGSFKKSLPTLRGCIALSEHLGKWLRKNLQLPTLVVKHPTEFPETQFSIDAYLANTPRKLVQVGWYLRNMRGIYQVPTPPTIEKIHLYPQAGWIKKAMQKVDKHSPFKDRIWHEPVTVHDRLPNDQYDQLLAESVVFLELFDSSANNAVVEAMARCTPLCVNRHPAVVEYLGAAYPLFYDDIQEVPRLLSDSNVELAHKYLKSLDRTELQTAYFVRAIQDFLNLLGPEL